MPTTRIEIEGPVGEASIERKGAEIVITGSRVTKVIERRDGQGVPISETFRLVGRARNHGANVVVAQRLQNYLDGVRGTNGDIADYLRAIETFED